VDDRLYGNVAETLLEVIGEFSDKRKCLMRFGHNPELTELAHRLSNEVTQMRNVRGCTVYVRVEVMVDNRSGKASESRPRLG